MIVMVVESTLLYFFLVYMSLCRSFDHKSMFRSKHSVSCTKRKEGEKRNLNKGMNEMKERMSEMKDREEDGRIVDTNRASDLAFAMLTQVKDIRGRTRESEGIAQIYKVF